MIKGRGAFASHMACLNGEAKRPLRLPLYECEDVSFQAELFIHAPPHELERLCGGDAGTPGIGGVERFGIQLFADAAPVLRHAQWRRAEMTRAVADVQSKPCGRLEQHGGTHR